MSIVLSNKESKTGGRTHGLATALALGVIGVLLVGCQGKPADQTSQNISTFQKMQQQLTDGRQQVGNTLASLDKYTQKPGLDTYNDFTSNVQQCQQTAYSVRNTSNQMGQEGDAYFQTWDAELASMSNADLRGQSAKQKDSVQQAYHQIAAQAPNVRAAYDKFMNDCDNLRTYFDRDKTASGVASASDLIATTKADGAELQRQLDQEIANLNNVKSMFTQMKQGTTT